jgi:hypothetical protein
MSLVHLLHRALVDYLSSKVSHPWLVEVEYLLVVVKLIRMAPCTRLKNIHRNPKHNALQIKCKV